jgi:purine-binding chemotaxis protein CheW
MPESLLILRHGAEILGIDLRVVREITRMMMMRRLPGAPAGVLGAVDVRGQVIPVLDLEARLPVGASRPSVESYLIILDLGEEGIDLAIAVNRIEEIEPLAASAFQSAESSLPEGVPLLGLARTSQGWVPVLDPRCLLGTGEGFALREAVRRLLAVLPTSLQDRDPFLDSQDQP